MNSLWTTAANEVANAAHWVATHPIDDVLCGIVAGAALLIGREIIKEKLSERRNSKDIAEKYNNAPEPPEFHYPAPTAETRAPR